MTSTANDAAITRLAPLIGTWRTTGEVLDEGGRQTIGTVEGTDAYEWLGTALILHRVAVMMGGEQVDQLEVIGPYDHERHALRTCAYDGASGAVEHATADVEADGTMLFRAGSDVTRAEARIRVADDGRTMAGGWSRTVDDGATWVPWLRIRWERMRWEELDQEIVTWQPNMSSPSSQSQTSTPATSGTSACSVVLPTIARWRASSNGS